MQWYCPTKLPPARARARWADTATAAWHALFLILLTLSVRLDAASDLGVFGERRRVVLGPLADLSRLQVTKDCWNTNAPTVGLRSKTLHFTVKPSECFIYATVEGFEYLAVKDLYPCTREGEPQVPMETFHIELDKDAEVGGIEVVAGRFGKVEGEVKIAPSPETSIRHRLIPNEAVYSVRTLFPGRLVRYERGCDNERQHVFVRFFPLQYAPAAKEAMLVTKATIRVHYRDAIKTRQDRTPQGSGSLDVIQRTITPSAECAIICSTALIEDAERLAGFHTREEGISSAVVTTEAIRAAYSPAEDPPFEGCRTKELGGWKIFKAYDYELARRIVSFLRDQASHPHLRYVTILGDATCVPPSYYCHVNPNKELISDAEVVFAEWVPTDLFYASPDYDLVPNYHIGRLSVRNATEAAHVVGKFERWHKQARAEWFKRVFLVGEPPSVHRFDSLRKDRLKGFQVKRLFLANDRIEKAYLTPAFTTADVGFVVISRHGSPFVIPLESSLITTEDLMSYNLHDKVPVVTALSCYVGVYDLGLVGLSAVYARTVTQADHSFGEALLLSKAGGIAFFGNSRLGGGGSTAYFRKGVRTVTHVKYGESLAFGPLEAYQNGAKSLGELNSKTLFGYVAKNDLVQDPTGVVDLFAHVFLGDPALMIPPW